jgi:hypothetical protein
MLLAGVSALAMLTSAVGARFWFVRMAGVTPNGDMGFE